MNMEQYESKLKDYNIIKRLLLSKLVEDDYIDEDDKEEIMERCQIVLYKGNWFKDWFSKIYKTANTDIFYVKIVDFKPKESKVDRLIRKTSGDYDS